jgi:hypothetical protein
MAEAASEYHHGDQDASAQVATYGTFNTLTKWGSLTVGTLILLLTMWFCTDAGFGGAFISAAILFVVGAWFLSRKPAGGH